MNLSLRMSEQADEDVVRAGVRALWERGAGDEMEVVLALFASFIMSAERVRQIVRWEMTVLPGESGRYYHAG